MYTLDPIILADLRKIDPKFDLRWNPEIERWELWHAVRAFTAEWELNGGVLGYVGDYPYCLERLQGPLPTCEYVTPDQRIVIKATILKAQEHQDVQKMMEAVHRNNRAITDQLNAKFREDCEYIWRSEYPRLTRFCDEQGICSEKSPEEMETVRFAGEKRFEEVPA